jgi:hypothetical protein
MKRRFNVFRLFRKTARPVFVVVALGLLLLLMTACDGTTPTVNNTVASTGSTLQMAENTVQQVRESIPYGYAFLVWSPMTKNLVVTLGLTSLKPNSVHPSHIHLGNCGMMGPIVYPLNNVVADGLGNAFATTTIAHVMKGIPASGWYINVHQGPGLSTPAQMAPIYCGNISSPSSSATHTQIIKVQLNAVKKP